MENLLNDALNDTLNDTLNNSLFDTNDNYETMDLKIINFIKMINNKDNEKIPIPTYFTISTQSAMCKINNANNIDLSKMSTPELQNYYENFARNADEAVTSISEQYGKYITFQGYL